MIMLTIKLGDHHTPHVHLLLECLGLGLTRLADAGVHHEDDVIRVHGVTHRQHLLEQTVLLFVPPTGVHDDHLKPFVSKHLHPVRRDDHGVHLRVAAVEGDAGLGGVLFELVIGAGPECVRTHQTRLPALLLIVIGQLGAGGGLPRALETHHHYDIGLTLHGNMGLHT